MTDVKSVQSKRAVLQAGMQKSPAASVAPSRDVEEKRDATDAPTPSASPPSKIPGLSTDELRALYEATVGGGSNKHKHYTAASANTPISSAAATTADLLSGIPQGSGSNEQRLGLQVRLKRIAIRGRLDWLNVANGPTASVGVVAQMLPVRIILAVDKMSAVGATIWAENVLPPVGDSSLVTTIAGSNPLTLNSVAPYNYNTHGTRYHILHDKVYLPETTASPLFNGTYVSCSGMKTFEIYADLHDMLATWYSAVGNQLLTNSVEMTYVCDDPTGGGASLQQYPKIQYISSLTYEEVPST